MKIVSLEELSRMPDGTVFAEVNDGPYMIDGELMIMVGRYGENYFNGVTHCTPCSSWDGHVGENEYVVDITPINTAKMDYEETDKFAVYSIDEVKDIIEALNQALKLLERNKGE